MTLFALTLAWIAALTIGFFAWPRLTLVLVVVIVLLANAGCADTRTADEREYDHVEWVETQFKPWVYACQRQGGVLMYDGPYSQRMRRILDKEQWDEIHRTEFNSFKCGRRD